MPLPPRIQKSLPEPVRRERPGMSQRHLANVRTLPSVISGGSPVEAHHLLRSGEHAMGRKSSDRWTVPLTPEEHRALHAVGDEDAWFAERGIDARAVAAALWLNRGDPQAMRRTVDRARQQARMKATG